jgi:hypothetical protein
MGAVRKVPLDRGAVRWAMLREPGGFDEEAVGGRGTIDAVRLIDGLLVDVPGANIAPGGAAALTLPERDLLLAAAYSMIWGPKIEGTMGCAGCGELFDYAFDLDEMTASLQAAAPDLPVENGVYTLPGGCRFRLPTAADELDIAGLSEADAERVLLERCIVEGDPRADGTAVLAAMDEIGSGIDVDLSAACAACGHAHALRFQIQDYLLGAISGNWANLVESVHRLALAYRWGLSEILSLPSSRRRAFVALLDGDSIARFRARP